MPNKFYLPAFLRRCSELLHFLERHQKAMIDLNGPISDPELSELTSLRADLEAIAGTASTWPSYKEGL